MFGARLDVAEGQVAHGVMVHETGLEYIHQLILDGGHRQEAEAVEAAPQQSLVIIPLALYTCVHFIEKNSCLNGLDFDDKAGIRGALRYQLNELCAPADLVVAGLRFC
jgi:hypothetical protein